MKFSSFCKFLAFFIIYGMLLVYFHTYMLRNFSSIFLITLALVLQAHAACTGDNDLTKPGFTICTGDMSPLPGVGRVSAWVGALLYILGKIADMLLFAIPLIAGISLIIAGYYYILSSGNTEKATQAKVIIKWNIVAMLVAFLSYTMVNIVLYILKL